MFCKNCGKENEDGSNFCSFCGTYLNEGTKNSAAFNFGKALGVIGTLAATSKIVDDFNEKQKKSMQKTMKVGTLMDKKVRLFAEYNGGFISKEEYDRREWDINKEIERIRNE